MDILAKNDSNTCLHQKHLGKLETSCQCI